MKKIINKIQKILDNIEAINYGGCGISALSIYRYFIKKGIDRKKISFIYLHDYKNDYINNKKNYKYKHFSMESPSHCCIYYDGKYIDSGGIIPKTKIKRYDYIHKFKTQSILLRSINNSDWNDEFDRNNIKIIQKELGINLKDIKI